MTDRDQVARRWTAEDLRALHACDEQVALFAQTFPDGATAGDVPAALAAGLHVEWLVRRVVSVGVWAEYDRQCATLWAEYERQRAPLWAEYERQRAPLRAEYERQRAPLLMEALRTVEVSHV